MSKLKAVCLCLAEMLSFAPCLCVFSEGDSLWVNIFGAVYGIAIYKFYTASPAGRKAVIKYLKSTIKLNPDINRI